MGKYKLGCGTWPYMFPPYSDKPYSLKQSLEMISKAGFEAVELSGFKPHAHYENYPAKTDRENLASEIGGYGLKIAGIAADLSGYPIASSDVDTRRKHDEVFDEWLVFCQDLDIKGMRVDTVSSFSGESGVSYRDAWDRVISTFKKDAQKAGESGVTLVWEFEPGFMFNKPGEIQMILKEVNHPNFKAMVDTCHAHCCGIGLNQGKEREGFNGYPVEVIDAPLTKIAAEFIRRLKGYIGHVHLIDSDNTLNEHKTSTHVPFRKGIIDFDDVMRALSEVGYKGYLVLDLCFWKDAWNETKECESFMESLVSKYG